MPRNVRDLALMTAIARTERRSRPSSVSHAGHVVMATPAADVHELKNALATIARTTRTATAYTNPSSARCAIACR
jgi:hypothetical protein